MPLKMNELPESERPYEKLKMYGSKMLSNSELLAIIIKTGTKEATALELASRILLLTENLEDLQYVSIDSLKHIKGIGIVKALQIKALCELANRMNKPIQKINRKIKTSSDIAKLFINELKYEKQEILKVVMLNSKNQIVRIEDIKVGTNAEIAVTPAQIIGPIVREQVPKFILIHNHPSGDSTPSQKDKEFTDRMKVCAKLLGISFLDHIVIGYGNYQSIFFREENEK